MRAIRDYPHLSISDLEDELATVASVLEPTIQQLGTAKIAHSCDHLMFYYQSPDETHAARSRYADYNTQTRFADLVEFEQQISAYRLNYETLVAFISWRRSDRGFEASRV